MVRRSLNDILKAEPDLDEAKLDALTEEDLQRFKAEEGYASFPDDSTPWQVVLPPATIRDRLGMTQKAFARALHIPVATLRNWEQGRKLPDPAARSLLNAVARNPRAVLQALDTELTLPKESYSSEDREKLVKMSEIEIGDPRGEIKFKLYSIAQQAVLENDLRFWTDVVNTRKINHDLNTTTVFKDWHRESSMRILRRIDSTNVEIPN